MDGLKKVLMLMTIELFECLRQSDDTALADYQCVERIAQGVRCREKYNWFSRKLYKRIRKMSTFDWSSNWNSS